MNIGGNTMKYLRNFIRLHRSESYNNWDQWLTCVLRLFVYQNFLPARVAHEKLLINVHNILSSRQSLHLRAVGRLKSSSKEKVFQHFKQKTFWLHEEKVGKAKTARHGLLTVPDKLNFPFSYCSHCFRLSKIFWQKFLNFLFPVVSSWSCWCHVEMNSNCSIIESRNKNNFSSFELFLVIRHKNIFVFDFHEYFNIFSS